MRDRSCSASALQRALVFTTLAVLFSSLSVAAAEKRRFDIAAGEAARTLNEFSGQAELQIYFDPDAVRSVVTRAVAGEFAAGDALAEMLVNTPLDFEFVNERTVAVMRRGERKQPITTLASMAHGAALARSEDYAGVTSTSDDRSRQARLRVAGGGEQASAAGEVDGQEGTSSSALDVVVITGTHIRGVAPDSSALTIYTRRDIERTGAETTEQFIRKLPQNLAVIDAGTTRVPNNADVSSNIGFRGSAINLRGLGADATLVLLNGRRLAPGGVSGSFVDVSMIPLSAIERVEVLTDGASAIYGSDAVAGVVNFVLRKNLDGAETALRYGDSTSGGAALRSISQSFGGTWRTGTALLAYDRQDRDPLRGDERDYVPNIGVGGSEGVRFLLPDQRRQAVILSAQQQLVAGTELFADAFYADRTIIVDENNGVSSTHTRGEGTQYGGAIGIDHDWSNGWRSEAVVNYSSIEQEAAVTFSALPAPAILPVRSKLASVDLLSEGSLFSIAGGRARLAIGAGARTETFDDRRTAGGAGTGLDRTVTSVYGELLLPFVGEANEVRGARRLELSLSARHDHYDTFGSSTDPKVGLVWAPATGLNVRSVYAESFRVPSLPRFSDAGRNYAAARFQDPNASDGFTNTLLLSAIGNSALEPERSNSLTFGFDFKSPKRFSLSATYFDIEYEDRVATPPVVGSITRIFFQTATLAPFIELSPNPAEVQRIFAEETLSNPLGLTPASIEAIYDGRLHNISISNASGIDLQSNLTFGTVAGEFSLFVNGSYLFDLERQATSLTAPVDLVDTIYQPVDLRLNGGMGWSRGRVSSAVAFAHTDDYVDVSVSPTGKVSSWTTVDLQFRYDSGDRPGSIVGKGISAGVVAQNVFDKDPPAVRPLSALSLGYDPVNASPLGRFISVSLTKRW